MKKNLIATGIIAVAVIMGVVLLMPQEYGGGFLGRGLPTYSGEQVIITHSGTRPADTGDLIIASRNAVIEYTINCKSTDGAYIYAYINDKQDASENEIGKFYVAANSPLEERTWSVWVSSYDIYGETKRLDLAETGVGIRGDWTAVITYQTLPEDCGNGVCDSWEDQTSCSQDCGEPVVVEPDCVIDSDCLADEECLSGVCTVITAPVEIITTPEPEENETTTEPEENETIIEPTPSPTPIVIGGTTDDMTLVYLGAGVIAVLAILGIFMYRRRK